MRNERRIAWLALTASCQLVVAASATTAHAEREAFESGGAASESGPELAARVGYATSYGRIEPGKRIRSEVAGAVPLWIDVGYRVDRRWFVGVYGQYGLALQGATSESRCPDCQYSWVRAGVQVQYRFFERGSRNLWLGLGMGRELLNVSIDEYEERSRSTSGWELVNAQFGSELQPVAGLGLGPFFSASIATYDQQTETCLDQTLCPRLERRVERALEDSGLHGWISAGVRVVLLP